MKLSLRPRYKQYLAALILISVSSFLIQSPFKTWLAYSYAEGPQPQGLMRASDVDPKNPDYYFLIGYYLNEYEYRDSNEAVLTNYKEALALSPFNYNYWFFLAEQLYEEGDREKALYALNQATALSPGTVSLRWRAGMLAAKLGDSDSVLENLRAVIAFDPDRHYKAFSLLWQSVRDGDRIIDTISGDALSKYFYFLLNTNRVTEAGVVLKRSKSLGYDSSDLAYWYVNEMIKQDKIEFAKEIWIDLYGSWDGVWNGGFEEELIKSGFGWSATEVDGVNIKRDRDSFKDVYSIMVDFDGEHNVDYYHLRQVIPVEENTGYTMRLFVKSSNLTTDQGLKWQVYCLDSNELYTESESISGSNDWQPLSLSFKTPVGCNAIVLRLRRNKSKKIDNLISGTIWIDDVQLKKTPNHP